MKRKTSFLERAALAGSPYERGRRFLVETIWQIDPEKQGQRWKRWGIYALRVAYLSGRGLASSRTQLQASALTYTSILAMVPLFTVVFSLFQSFVGLQGPGERLKDFVLRSISPSLEQEQTLRAHLDEFVVNTQKSMSTGGGIAGVAFIFLVFTVITLLGSIESTMNDVWGVKRSRTWTQKFITYWALATLGPVLLSIALVAGSTASSKVSSLLPNKVNGWLSNPNATTTSDARPIEPALPFHGIGGALANRHLRLDAAHSDLVQTPHDEISYIITGRIPTAQEEQEQRGSRYTSFILTVIAFQLLYQFMPNTKVRFRPALTGGILAAFAWQLSKWGLATGSSALVKYNTIYGGLAAIPILMFWLYISWLIVILGCELTFAIQNLGTQGKEELAQEASERCREIVALRFMGKIALAFEGGAQPPRLTDLAHALNVPHALVAEIVFHLCEDGLLREIELPADERGYVPSKPIASITLGAIARSLRERDGINFTLEDGADARALEVELKRADAAELETFGQVTLEDFLRAVRAAEQAREPALAAGGGAPRPAAPGPS